MDAYGEKLEHKARAFNADDKSTRAEGVIVSYCPAPTYSIRREDGTELYWRCDLTEITSDEKLQYGEPGYPPRTDPPQRDPHYLIADITRFGLHEAVCFCGALFRAANPMYGTIGEMFAAHVRLIRAREAGKRDD